MVLQLYISLFHLPNEISLPPMPTQFQCIIKFNFEQSEERRRRNYGKYFAAGVKFKF